MLSRIIKVLKALNSNEAPWQISLGIIFGSILGLTPLFSLHNLAILFLALVIQLEYQHDDRQLRCVFLNCFTPSTLCFINWVLLF